MCYEKEKLASRVLTLLLSWILMLNMVFPIYATEAAEELATISVSNGFCYQNGGENITVTLKNIENLGGLEYSIYYDASVFQVTSATSTSDVSGTINDINTKEEGVIHHSIISVDGLSGNVSVLRIHFTSKSNADLGKYPLKIAITEAKDTSFQSVHLQKVNGLIEVIENMTVQRADFYGKVDGHCQYGKSLNYNLMGTSLGGLAGGNFVFTYDPEVLEVRRADVSSSLKTDTAIYSINTEEKGIVRISYMDLKKIQENRAVVFISFNVIKNEDMQTQIIATQSNLLDENLKNVEGTKVVNTITIEKVVDVENHPVFWLAWDGIVHDDDTVDVEVMISKDSKIAAGDFRLTYLQTMDLISAKKSETLNSEGIVVFNDNVEEKNIKFSYINTNPPTEDTAIVELKFQLNPSSYNLLIAYDSDGIYDLDFKPLLFTKNQSYYPLPIHIANATIGDIEAQYDSGESIQPKVTIFYKEKELLENENYTVSYENNDKPGQAKMVIKGKNGYRGTIEKAFTIFGVDAITVSKLPNQLDYIQGSQNLSLEGGLLDVTYQDGTTQTIDLNKARILEFDSSILGEQEVVVEYGTAKTTIVVNIIEASVNSLEISALPDKLSYLEGKDVLDLSGGILKVIYNSGLEEMVPFSNATVIGFDHTKVGKQVLEVTYKDVKVFFEIEIIPKAIASISVEKYPTKLEYLQNETLNFSDGQIRVHYNNETYEIINMDEMNVLNYDSSKIGTQQVTLDYQGFETTVEILVIEKEVVLYGDVNNNGIVNNQDRMILTRYLAEWTGYETLDHPVAADVNQDGQVNNKDRMILTRHLAEWTGYEVLPNIN